MSRTFIGTTAVLAGLLLAPLAAQAVPHPQEPTPTSSAQVSVKLAELSKKSEQLAEQLDKARIDVGNAQRAAAAAAVVAQRAEVTAQVARRALATSLASQYKAASFSRTAALLASSSTDGYLQTVQSMNLLTEHQSEVATMAANAIVASKQAVQRAQSAVATAVRQRAELSKRRVDLDAQVAKYKSLLATLTAAERAKFFTPVAPPSATQVRQVVAAATAPLALPKSASKGAAAAIAAAQAELGKPYVWGASGPDSFDCSGLTAWAWGAAGVSLPHNAAAQQGMGTSVPQSALQPGDLVFFGSPAYHVALYIGSGLIIHAPTTGDVVKVVSLSVMSDYSGATRVG